MANAIRTITVRRGIDPRTFSLVAYGGAGPMHAAEIARLLGIRKVVVPQSAGAFSAWGMLQSDLIHDLAETMATPLNTLDWNSVRERFAPMEAELKARLIGEGAAADALAFERAIDVRYVGQEYAIPVPLDAAVLAPSADPAKNYTSLRAKFDSLYEATYGHSNPQELAEVATLRLRAIGKTSLNAAAFASAARIEEDLGFATRTRTVLFDGTARETRFIARRDLKQGEIVAGPLVVEEATCTTIVPPDFTATIDDQENLVLALQEGA
jgi:N-methylhydantoinase A